MKSCLLVCLLLSPGLVSASNVNLDWSGLVVGLDAASHPLVALPLGIGLLAAGRLLRRRLKLTGRTVE